ncbi:hypothetical protein ACOMHN_051170 [Nucella lapillus]
MGSIKRWNQCNTGLGRHILKNPMIIITVMVDKVKHRKGQQVPDHDYDSGFDSFSASPSTHPSSHGGQAKDPSTPALPQLKRLTIPLVRVDSPEFFCVGSPLFLGWPVKRKRTSSQEEQAAQEKLPPPPPLLAEGQRLRR